jgi:hypothetical protein
VKNNHRLGSSAPASPCGLVNLSIPPDCTSAGFAIPPQRKGWCGRPDRGPCAQYECRPFQAAPALWTGRLGLASKASRTRRFWAAIANPSLAALGRSVTAAPSTVRLTSRKSRALSGSIRLGALLSLRRFRHASLWGISRNFWRTRHACRTPDWPVPPRDRPSGDSALATLAFACGPFLRRLSRTPIPKLTLKTVDNALLRTGTDVF